jgi:hypothetical protein
MPVDLSGAIDRMVELEIEALAALSTPVTADAKPYFYHTQESYPYWTNRVGPVSFDDDEEDFDEPTYTITSRLVIAHATADYKGQNEVKLKLWIPQIITYFHARPRLGTATLNRGLNSLIHARIGGCTGFRIFQTAGIQPLQVGCEFTHLLQFSETIDLAYG